MTLSLRGRSKARLEIQWGGPLPVELTIVSLEYLDKVLHRMRLDEQKVQLELDQIDFSSLGDANELNLLVSDRHKKFASESLKIQKCHHSGCGNWGHAREDGYCRHCGRRIKEQEYSYGFPKLELSECTVVLWNGTDGKLSKKKESRVSSSAVHSMGKYEDKDHSRDYVEVLEEKFDPELAERFVRLQSLLRKGNLLDKFWRPPLAAFQEQHRRSVWIYYPFLPKEKGWLNDISASSYIFSKEVQALTVKEIAGIGLQLCRIAEAIHEQGYLWASLKLSDLILSRNKQKEVSLYLRTRDIAWNSTPSKDLLESCLIPWELFCEEENGRGHEVSEVYIIAALLYFLKAKSPNLLSYNPLSYPYGLPTLKLFCDCEVENLDYFESVINQATLLDPSERGYQSVREFQDALNRLMALDSDQRKPSDFGFDVGRALEVGDQKKDSDATPNQDAVFVSEYTLEKHGWGIFALCDGVSTATIGSGDFASRIVIDAFQGWWMQHDPEEQRKLCETAAVDFESACRQINEVVDRAHRKIFLDARKIAECDEPEGLIMGTTVTTGMVYRNSMIFGWLGDSPIYRFHPSIGWERMNYDHNERNYRLKEGMPLDDCFIEGGNALTHCVGAHRCMESHLEMSFGRTSLHPGEQILICSDGIPDYIEQESAYAHNENYQMLRIASIFYEYGNDSLIDAGALSSVLLSGVNRVGGGHDNLSAILIRVLPEGFRSVCYPRLKALGKGMQTLMRRTNLEPTGLVPGDTGIRTGRYKIPDLNSKFAED